MRHVDILAPSDNQGVVALLDRGRTSKMYLDRHVRRVAAAEALLDSKLRVPWVDTTHQPGDEGTREINHKLILGKVVWKHVALFMEIARSPGQITVTVTRRGLEVADAWVLDDSKYFRLLNRPAVRRLLRLLETGQIYVMWWHFSRSPIRPGETHQQKIPSTPTVPMAAPDPQISLDDRILMIAEIAIRIVHHHRAQYVFITHLRDWPHDQSQLQSSFINTSATFITFRTCCFGARTRLRYRAAGALTGLHTLQRRCGHGGRCQQALRATLASGDGVWPEEFRDVVAAVVADAVGSRGAMVESTRRQ